MASANGDSSTDEHGITGNPNDKFSCYQLTARAFTLLLVIADACVLACVYAYYTSAANPSRYQIMQVAMLTQIFIVLPIVVGQWFVLTRTAKGQISRKEHQFHKGLAVAQLYFLLLVMLLPAIF